MSSVEDTRTINKMAWIDFFFFLNQSIFRFQDLLYYTLFKDDSQLCYKIYNKMIWYTILFYAICV